MGESVLNNLIYQQMLILRRHTKQENYLFWLCIEGGMLIIADSTENRYVHNRTEGFPCRTWFCRVIRPVKKYVLQMQPIYCDYIGNRMILKLENTKHTFLLMSSTKIWSESAFLCCHLQIRCNKLFFQLLCLRGVLFLSDKVLPTAKNYIL